MSVRVSAAREMVPVATASRATGGLAPTSTMLAVPSGERWVSWSDTLVGGARGRGGQEKARGAQKLGKRIFGFWGMARPSGLMGDHPGWAKWFFLRRGSGRGGGFSAADGDHFAVGLVVVAEVVVFGFAVDDGAEEVSELVVGGAGAEGFHDVELEVGAEAGAEFAVAGEAEFVTGLAEVEVGHGADEADHLVAAGDGVVGGRAVGFEVGAGLERGAERLFDEFFGGVGGEEVVFVEHLRGGDGHEFDEAEEQVFLVCEVDEGGEFGLGVAAGEDGVDFDAFEAGVEGGVDAVEGVGEVVAAGDFGVAVAVEGIERDVGGADAGSDEGFGDGAAGVCGVGAIEEGGVGGDADVGQGVEFGEFGEEGGDIAAGEGFAAGDADFVDSEGGADFDEAEDFLVGEDAVAGEPFLGFLGHAVGAALVAAVGDRDAEVGDLVAVRILHGRTMEWGDWLCNFVVLGLNVVGVPCVGQVC